MSHPLILIVEDDPVTALLFEKIILTQFPDCRPIWAKDLSEGKLRASGVSVTLFVIDVNLPDGSGLDFLWDMSNAHPDAQAIVMSATPQPEYEAQSVALGALRFLPKPIAAPKVKQVLEEVLAARRAGVDNAFRASLKNLSLFDIVQLKCLSGSTATLQFSCEGRSGQIHIQDGEIIDAQCGELGGIEALKEMARWRTGSAQEVPLRNLGIRSIHTGWQSLVMDLAQAMDESSPK